jgi:hypothetical protein
MIVDQAVDLATGLKIASTRLSHFRSIAAIHHHRLSVQRSEIRDQVGALGVVL